MTSEITFSLKLAHHVCTISSTLSASTAALTLFDQHPDTIDLSELPPHLIRKIKYETAVHIAANMKEELHQELWHPTEDI